MSWRDQNNQIAQVIAQQRNTPDKSRPPQTHALNLLSFNTAPASRAHRRDLRPKVAAA